MYIQSTPSSTYKVYPNHEALISLKSITSKTDGKSQNQNPVSEGKVLSENNSSNALMLLLLLLICSN